MRVGKLFGAGALLLSLGLFAAACGDDSGSSSATTGGGSSATTASGSAAAPGAAKCNGVALGFFGALTGDNANLGVNIEQGVELAVDQFNDRQRRLPGHSQEVRQPGQPGPGSGACEAGDRRRIRHRHRGPGVLGRVQGGRPAVRRGGSPDHHPVGHEPDARRERVEDLPPGARQRRLPGPRRGDLHRLDAEGLQGLRDRRRERVRQGSRRPGQLDARLEGRRHRHHRPVGNRLSRPRSPR